RAGSRSSFPSASRYSITTLRPLDVTQVTQFFEEGVAQVGASGHVGRQVAYSSDLARLLGLGGERRRPERKQCKYRVTPVHSTPPWSLRISTGNGISRRRARSIPVGSWPASG